MRVQPGSGSKSSPIFISDDEEEVADVSGLLLDDDEQLSSTSLISQSSAHKKAAKPSSLRNPTAKSQQLVHEVPKKRKRKREHSSNPQNAAGPSRLPSTRISQKTKRARHHDRISHWNRDEPAVFDDSAFQPDPRALTGSFSPYSVDGFSSMAGDSKFEFSSFSSSEWVNSMAKAADPPESLQNLFPIPLDFLVPPPTWNTQPHLPDNTQSSSWPPPSIPTPSAVLPDKPVQTLASSTTDKTIVASSKKPSSTSIIGMPSSRDPDGKRCGFKLSASTMFESRAQITYPHLPDPSRSLILDQLPKLCRTFLWLKSWSQDACGTQPVFIAIDPSSARALLEFAVTNQAEKAWGSPKLGKNLGSLNSAQLKGASREDLIRAWWYLPSLPEAVFIRKELEEGEIEDDESMVDGRKESKKEKKLRLAKLAKEEMEKKKKEVAESRAKPRNDQPLPRSSSTSSSSSTLVAQEHSLSASPDHRLLNHILPPPSAPSLSRPLTAVFSSSQPASSRSTLTVQSEASQTPAMLRPISHNWHQSYSENAFIGPLAVHRSSTQSVNDARFDLAADDDISMELSSPLSASEPGAVLTNEAVCPSFSVASTEHETPRISSAGSTQSLSTLTPTPPVFIPGRAASPLLSSVPLASNTVVAKSTPQEPSFVKRSLLARQKELEERIARSKLALERSGVSAETNSDTTVQLPVERETLTPTPLAPASHTSSPSLPEPDKQAMEDHLRRLVLASQRKKQQTSAYVAAAKAETRARSLAERAVITDPGLSSGNRDTQAPSTDVNSALDDLAVSFIQESIQTITPSPSLPNQFPVKPATSNPSAGLAARREQLEFQIAESKRLMGLLSQTTSKQERDDIMIRIRDISRTQEQASSSPPTSNLTHTPYPSFLVKPIEPAKSFWPESVPDGGIFIVSDDEDVEDDE